MKRLRCIRILSVCSQHISTIAPLHDCASSRLFPLHVYFSSRRKTKLPQHNLYRGSLNCDSMTSRFLRFVKVIPVDRLRNSSHQTSYLETVPTSLESLKSPIPPPTAYPRGRSGRSRPCADRAVLPDQAV